MIERFHTWAPGLAKTAASNCCGDPSSPRGYSELKSFDQEPRFHTQRIQPDMCDRSSSLFGGRSQAPPSSLQATRHSARQSPRCSQKPSGLSACAWHQCILWTRGRGRSRAIAVSPSTFLSGALRRCKSPSALSALTFHAKGIIERRAAAMRQAD